MTEIVQKIREKVEMLKSQLLRGACSSQIAMETRCKEEAYNEVLAILDSMQEEPVSEELEEAAEERVDAEDYSYIDRDGNPLYDSDYLEYMFKEGANWQKKQDKSTIELAEDHAMLAGMEKMKKEIMKEPNLFGYVARDENGNLHIFEVKPKRLEEEHRWWDRDYNCHIIDNDAFPDLRWKDEPICVKLIIIKED